MSSFNRVIMAGNLTRDPDYKQFPSGQGVCRLGLASNRQFRNKQTGDMIQEVCYVDIDVWGAQAESCRQFLQKGRAVLVEGRLKFDSWDDANGQKRSKHSIVADRVVFLSSGAQADVAEEVGGVQTRAQDPAEKEIMDQIEKIKSRNQERADESSDDQFEAAKSAKKKAKKVEEEIHATTSTGEVEFQDEPPFQDDLPF